MSAFLNYFKIYFWHKILEHKNIIVTEFVFVVHVKVKLREMPSNITDSKVTMFHLLDLTYPMGRCLRPLSLSIILQIFRAGPSFRSRYFIIISELNNSKAFPGKIKESCDEFLLWSVGKKLTINLVSFETFNVGAQSWVQKGNVWDCFFNIPLTWINWLWNTNRWM